MHILFLSDNFPPEVNAPASRTFEHCREWVREGHQVTVVTCVPNFPEGKVFAGYKNKIWQVEQMEGIEVIRVWSYIAENSGFTKRIFDYISFMLSAIFASLFVRKPVLVIGTSPQFFTVCAAYIVSRLKRIPFIFELRDIWPESIKAVGAMKDSLAIRMLEKIELFLYRKADLIISVTHSFKENLIQRGINASKIHIITNGVDMSRFQRIPKDKELLKRYSLKDKFVAGYVGTHGMAHHLETILEAAALAQKNNTDDIRFILLGNGARKKDLVQLASEMGLKNVIFIDSVPKEEVSRYWSLLDVSIIHLQNTELFKSIIPSKLFECMGMGIPVLYGVLGESAKIVGDNEVGILFEPECPTQLYNGLLQLKENSANYTKFSKNCVSVAKQYNRSVLAKKYIKLLATECNKSS